MKLFQKLINLLNKCKSTQTKLVLNGKEIDLTADNTIIKSNNFNVDKNGNMTCSKANITGGNIDMTAEREEVILRVHCIDWTGAEIESIITPGSFDVYNRNDYDVPLISVGTITYLNGEEGHIRITSNMDNEETRFNE